jgi:hypothetical protein
MSNLPQSFLEKIASTENTPELAKYWQTRYTNFFGRGNFDLSQKTVQLLLSEQIVDKPITPLGEIYLSKHLDKNKELDQIVLQSTIETAVRFLDSCLEAINFSPETYKIVDQYRKIALGIADFEEYLEIKNPSNEIGEIDFLGNFISNYAYRTSETLAEEKGDCQSWSKIYKHLRPKTFEYWFNSENEDIKNGLELIDQYDQKTILDSKFEIIPRRNSHILLFPADLEWQLWNDRDENSPKTEIEQKNTDKPKPNLNLGFLLGNKSKNTESINQNSISKDQGENKLNLSQSPNFLTQNKPDIFLKNPEEIKEELLIPKLNPDNQNQKGDVDDEIVQEILQEIKNGESSFKNPVKDSSKKNIQLKTDSSLNPEIFTPVFVKNNNKNLNSETKKSLQIEPKKSILEEQISEKSPILQTNSNNYNQKIQEIELKNHQELQKKIRDLENKNQQKIEEEIENIRKNNDQKIEEEIEKALLDKQNQIKSLQDKNKQLEQELETKTTKQKTNFEEELNKKDQLIKQLEKQIEAQKSQDQSLKDEFETKLAKQKTIMENQANQLVAEKLRIQKQDLQDQMSQELQKQVTQKVTQIKVPENLITHTRQQVSTLKWLKRKQ